MASFARRALGSFLAATMIATPVVACAEDASTAAATTETVAPANENIQASVSTQQQGSFRAVNLSSQAPGYILEVARNNSSNKNIVIAWGGTESLRDQVQMGLEDLVRDNPRMDIVMIEGPELNGFNGDIELYFLPQGSTSLYRTSQGLRAIDSARQDIYNYGQVRFGGQGLERP